MLWDYQRQVAQRLLDHVHYHLAGYGEDFHCRHGDRLRRSVAGYGGGQLSSVERAETLTNGELGPWEVLGSQLLAPRERPGAAVVQGHLIVAGGLSYSTGGIVASTEYAEVLAYILHRVKRRCGRSGPASLAP